ncbi:MAG: hypothetical protein HRU15_03780 [Planctomycetes bacterium]|nr:hypothetical protein [Planctomycetota bacterium]
MRFVILCILSLSSALLSAAAVRPIQAELHRKDGSVKPVWVFAEKVSKIELARNGDSMQTESSISWDKVKKVVYLDGWMGVDYPRALNAYRKNKLDDVTKHTESAINGKSEKLRIESAKLMAEGFIRQKKYDEAIAALNKVVSGFAQWRFLHQIQTRIGEVQLMKKDTAAAKTQIGKLKNMGAWGSRAKASAAILEAKMLQSEKKAPEAAVILQTAISSLSSDEAPNEKAAVALALMKIHAKGEKLDDVIATGAIAEWVPAENADISAEIHVMMAHAYLAKDDADKAFYQCALAASIPGNSGKETAKARKIARSIISAMKKAEEPNKDLIKTYSKAMANF